MILGFLMLSTILEAKHYTETEYLYPLNSNGTIPILNRRSQFSPSSSIPLKHLEVTLTDPISRRQGNNIKISSIAEVLAPNFHKKLLDVTNYFLTADNSTIVFFDKDLRSWVLQQFDEAISDLMPKRGRRISLARCLSTEHGGGGYVTAQLDASVYAEGTFTGAFELILLVSTTEVLASLGAGSSMGSAAGYTGSVSCILGSGQYAQPYLYPYFFDIPKSKRIKAKYIENKGLELYGKWQEMPSFLKIIARGLLECAIGNDSSVCDSMFSGASANVTSGKLA